MWIPTKHQKIQQTFLVGMPISEEVEPRMLNSRRSAAVFALFTQVRTE